MASIVERAYITTVLVLLVSTVNGQANPDIPPQVRQYMQKGMPAGPNHQAAIEAHKMVADPIVLTEAQLQGFFAAVKEMKTLGKDARAFTNLDPGKPQAMAKGMELSAEAQAVLAKNGFKDALEFQRVGYNAALAHAVLTKGGKKAVVKELEKSEAQQAKAMEQMKAHMSDEQIAALKGQMNAGMGMANSMKNVPDRNVELIAKYRGEMEALNRERR